MVDFYSLCCIVREAEDQARKDGNAHKYILAELYRKKHFDIDLNRGIRNSVDKIQPYFRTAITKSDLMKFKQTSCPIKIDIERVVF
jgi:hypothetical protein